MVIFNPAPEARSRTASFTVWDPGNPRGLEDMRKKTYIVHTTDGRILPAESVETGALGDHFYSDLVFPVTVGPMGYASFVIEEGLFTGPHPGQVKVNGKQTANLEELTRARELTIENESILARFDRATGGVAALVDKKTGIDFVPPGQPMGVVEYLVERPRDMSAWTMDDPKTRLFPLPVSRLRVRLANPYVASLESKMKIGESDVTVTYTLRSGEPYLEVAVHALWLQRGASDIGTPTLRMLFPTSLEKAAGTYEIPFGTITRDLNKGEEVPSQRFADVSGQTTPPQRGRRAGDPASGNRPAGVLVLNDSKYGHSLQGSTLAARPSGPADRTSRPRSASTTSGWPSCRTSEAADAAAMIRAGRAFNRPLQSCHRRMRAGSWRRPGLTAIVRQRRCARSQEGRNRRRSVVRLTKPRKRRTACRVLGAIFVKSSVETDCWSACREGHGWASRTTAFAVELPPTVSPLSASAQDGGEPATPPGRGRPSGVLRTAGQHQTVQIRPRIHRSCRLVPRQALPAPTPRRRSISGGYR
jgi:hypothetical protein